MAIGYQSHEGKSGDSASAEKLSALHLPDLLGKSFLDIGCNEGFFCNHALNAGASRVVGIDHSERVIETARRLYPGIDFRCQSWDILPEGKFDVILHSSALHYAADPYAHIQRIHSTLTDDGVFVLECGVSPHNHSLESGIYEIGSAYWERTNRGFDNVYHPSESLLRNDLLEDFSIRVIGQSVIQKGDPLSRKVYHCRKFKRMVMIIGGAGGTGKSSLTFELQRRGVTSFGSDFMLERLIANAGRVENHLSKALSQRSDDLKKNAGAIYRWLVDSEYLSDFVDEFYAMIPKRQRLLIVEGYAFGLPKIREAVSNKLMDEGFAVHQMQTDGNAALSATELLKKTDANSVQPVSEHRVASGFRRFIGAVSSEIRDHLALKITEGVARKQSIADLDPAHQRVLTLNFGLGGNAEEFTVSGWASNEPGYRWSLGSESRLSLPRPPCPGNYKIVALVRPFTFEDVLQSQRVIAMVNGTVIGAAAVRQPAALECEIPWPLLQAGNRVLVTFWFPDAARPSALKEIADDRMLAFAFETLELHGPAVESENDAKPAPLSVSDSSLPIKDLMLRFESLGENCEFGLVQRHCGVEPVGLLRFASSPLSKLLPALETRFEGVADPAGLRVTLSENGREYMVDDGRFGLHYHAWVLAGEMAPEEIRQREITQLPVLVKKLIEDLTCGEKIFVYHGLKPLGQHEILSLAAALRSYGPGILLWVELADSDDPAGTVSWVADNVLKAHLDRFAPGENAHDLSLGCWIEICRKALGLKEERRSRPAGEPHGAALAGSAQTGDAERVRPATAGPAHVGESVQKRPDLEPAELMMRFESLGENCEFGLVQRRCGVEPVGLLPFASAPLSKLLAALEAQFEGLGARESIAVELSSNGREYMVRDNRYGVLYHAWILADEMAPEDIREREARRLPLLIRKLVEDLTAGRKLLVMRGMDKPLDPAQVARLVSVLRRYGPNTLLWVVLSDDEHPAGSVEWAAPNLLKGYIDRFAPGENAHDLSLDCWLVICRAAHQLWQESEASRAQPVSAAAHSV